MIRRFRPSFAEVDFPRDAGSRAVGDQVDVVQPHERPVQRKTRRQTRAHGQEVLNLDDALFEMRGADVRMQILGARQIERQVGGDNAPWRAVIPIGEFASTRKHADRR